MNNIHFAKLHHQKQTRATGESYVYHPVRVGRAVEDFGLEQKYVTVAMLHDVLEMTNCSKEDIKHFFGEEVAEMVEYLSKKPKEYYLEKYKKAYGKEWEERKFNDHPWMYGKRIQEYVEKIERGAKKYPEILIIKLCDQLDNLKDCMVFTEKKMTRIVETMTLQYIPLYERNRKVIPEKLRCVYDLLFERFLERLELVRSLERETSV